MQKKDRKIKMKVWDEKKVGEAKERGMQGGRIAERREKEKKRKSRDEWRVRESKRRWETRSENCWKESSAKKESEKGSKLGKASRE